MKATRFPILVLVLIAPLGCRDRDPADEGPGTEPPDLNTPAEIRITPLADTLAIGDTLQLSATVLNRGGAILPMVQISWSVSDSLHAVINASGRVIAKLPGTVIVRARVDTLATTATLWIAAPAIKACSSPGVVHKDPIVTETWHAAHSPHHVPAEGVTVTGVVIVEAGALICGAETARIRLEGAGARLSAVGTAADPIVFTATDSTKRWFGVRVNGGGALIRHARIEHVGSAVFATSCTDLTVDSVHVRQAGSGVGALQICPLSVTRSVFDTIAGTAIHSRPADAILNVQTSQLDVTVEDNIIRNANLGMEFWGWSGEIVVNGSRIEDSRGGIVVASGSRFRVADGVSIVSQRPVRIVRSGSVIGNDWAGGTLVFGAVFSGTVRAFATIWPRASDRDSLAGNYQDTVLLSGGFAGELLVTKQNPVMHVVTIPVSAVIPFTGPIERVRITAGGQLRSGVGIGTLIVEGTAAEPAILVGRFQIGCAEGFAANCTRIARDTSRIKHARLMSSGFGAGTPIIVDSVEVRPEGSYYSLAFFGAGSSFTHVTFDGALDFYFGAPNSRLDHVAIRGSYSDGFNIIASNVAVSNCVISDNGRNGIRILRGSAITINDCNIERNGDFGVLNETAEMVDAQRNWWGDPDGPLGPNGDGVSGLVDFNSYRTGPLTVLQCLSCRRRDSNSQGVTPARF